MIMEPTADGQTFAAADDDRCDRKKRILRPMFASPWGVEPGDGETRTIPPARKTSCARSSDHPARFTAADLPPIPRRTVP
jgi:hypothetical protein